MVSLAPQVDDLQKILRRSNTIGGAEEGTSHVDWIDCDNPLADVVAADAAGDSVALKTINGGLGDASTLTTADDDSKDHENISFV